MSILLPWGFSATVDDEDYERLKHYKYLLKCSGSNMYPFRRVYKKGRCKRIFLHYDVLQVPNRYPRLVIDHINCKTLDCTRSNLRVVTSAQNAQRRRPTGGRFSKYKGISYDGVNPRRKRRWYAHIKTKGRVIRRYCYDEYSAVKWYNVTVYRLFGKFCYLNNWDGPTRREESETTDPASLPASLKLRRDKSAFA